MKTKKPSKRISARKKREVFTRRRDGSLVLKLNGKSSNLSKAEQDRLTAWGVVLQRASTFVYHKENNKTPPDWAKTTTLIDDLAKMRSEVMEKLLDLNHESGKKVTLS